MAEVKPKVQNLMKNKKLFIAIIIMGFLLSGCVGDKGDIGPKGTKGDTGAAGGAVSQSYVYSGTVTSANPQLVTVPELTHGLNTMSISCYASVNSEWKELPFTEYNGVNIYEHTVIINITNSRIEISTYHSPAGGLYNGPALLGKDYKIIVRAFGSPQLRAKWLELNASNPNK